MKTALIILFLLTASKLSIAQELRQNIDYQYHRGEKVYYAFELYKNIADDKLMLNFVCNEVFKNIDKIYLKAGNEEVKLSFKERAEVIRSDNPEYKFYPVSISFRDLERKIAGRKMQIVFKLDNGSILTLPFNALKLSELARRN